MPGMFDWLYKPLTDAPTRIAKRISQAVDPIEPMQPNGQGGLRDWAAWTDASAKGLLQGSGEAVGSMLSDMTSPFSIGMTALGGKGLQRLASAGKMARNAMRVAPAAEEAAASTIGRLGAEFAPVGSETAVNTARAANVAKDAKTLKRTARVGAAGETSITMKNQNAMLEDMHQLPTVESNYAKPGGMSVYKPDTAREMGRLMVNMMDEGSLKDAATIAHTKYPRMFGHIGEISTDVPYKGMQKLTVAGDARNAGDAAGRLTNIRINPDSVMAQSGYDVANALGHEMTHGAQRLRKGNQAFRQAYDSNMGQAKIGLTKELEYLKNPMEVQARKAGKKFAKFATRSE